MHVPKLSVMRASEEYHSDRVALACRRVTAVAWIFSAAC
jgi:hypothetical protein